MMMSKPLSTKYSMSAICFSLLSSAERIFDDGVFVKHHLALDFVVHFSSPIVA